MRHICEHSENWITRILSRRLGLSHVCLLDILQRNNLRLKSSLQTLHPYMPMLSSIRQMKCYAMKLAEVDIVTRGSNVTQITRSIQKYGNLVLKRRKET
jgi:hypothetical protein